MDPTTAISSYLAMSNFLVALMTYAPIALIAVSAERAATKIRWIALIVFARFALAAAGIAIVVFVMQSIVALFWGAFLVGPIGILMTWLMYLRFARKSSSRTEESRFKTGEA